MLRTALNMAHPVAETQASLFTSSAVCKGSESIKDENMEPTDFQGA